MRLGAVGPWLGQVPLVRGPYLGASAPATLTDATFQQALSAPKAVVDFWSPTCPHCMQYKPDFEAVAAQAPGDVLFFEADVSDANQSAQKYGFQSIPTTVFLMNGQMVNKVEGEMTQQDLLAAIASSFSGTPPAAAPAAASAPASSAAATPSPSVPSSARTVPPAPASSSLSPVVTGGITLAAIAGLGYFIFK